MSETKIWPNIIAILLGHNVFYHPQFLTQMFGFTVVKIDFNYICFAKYILNKNEIITNNNNLVKVLYIFF